jgi:uncharacterized protein YdaU (DUF1376 family)
MSGKKDKSPAFQWYPKDILSSQRVTLMDLKTEGAYRRALDFCWLHESLPADERSLAILIGKGCTAKMAAEVKSMFIENDGKLRHDRLDEEREKQENWRKKSSEAGKKSAKKRWAPDNQNVTNLITVVEPTLQNGCNQNVTLLSSSPSSLNTKIYIRPRDFLKMKNEIELQQSQMKRGMPAEEWERCIEQWSLKKESEPFEYSDDEGKDMRALFASLTAYSNTWAINYEAEKRKLLNKNTQNGKLKPGGQHLTGDYDRYKTTS